MYCIPNVFGTGGPTVMVVLWWCRSKPTENALWALYCNHAVRWILNDKMECFFLSHFCCDLFPSFPMKFLWQASDVTALTVGSHCEVKTVKDYRERTAQVKNIDTHLITLCVSDSKIYCRINNN